MFLCGYQVPVTVGVTSKREINPLLGYINPLLSCLQEQNLNKVSSMSHSKDLNI